MISFCLVSSDHGAIILSRMDYNEGNENRYGVGHQILETNSYDPDEVEFLKGLLDERRIRHGDGVIAVDCGANIGVHTLEWSRHMRGWGSVVAIEAQERIFYALAGNIALQNCFNARAIWAAVDTKTGEMKIPEPDYEAHGSYGSLELRQFRNTEYIGQCIDYEEPTLKVRTLSIDSLQLPRVDLIKMDIEGMEMDALSGAVTTIQGCRPYLFFEVTKSDETEIGRFLKHVGYSVVRRFGMNVLAKHD